MHNIVLFGAPGCGKGTQSAKIKENYNLHHISTGDLLRGEIERNSRLGRTAAAYINEGNLIPDDLMVDILDAELERHKEAEGVIFDGFPRTIPQAHALKRLLKRRGMAIDHVIGLEVPDEVLTERLINRGKTSGRVDDNPEAIANRLKVYHNTTVPLQEFYKNEGLYRAIDGNGTVDDIFDTIRRTMDGEHKA